eukprot:TRINITY_DN7171_c0_g1_i1.p1 TRINITY_DN7171_c0_g1~~TRINITY_DN7171_c0_g1_i1.p1  ORF type:complete len:719 (+),score=284.77 TRINITY_DN7171_c0_g1_i1:318-2159(+)
MEWVPDASKLSIYQHSTTLTDAQKATLRTAFDMIDSNKKGRISREELRELLVTLDVVSEPGQIDTMMASLGTPTFDAVVDAITKQSFYQMQEGRYFVALSLTEAEHLRAALPRIGGSVALLALPLRDLLDGSMVFDKSEWHVPQPPASAQGKAAEACLRFLNSDSAWPDSTLDWALRCLQGTQCAARRDWWVHVRDCRRRRLKPWQELPVAQLFVTGDEYSSLASKTIVLRAKTAMAARRLWPADCYALMDTDHNNVLLKQELYEGLVWLGVSVTQEQADLVFAMLDTNKDGKISLEEFKAYLTPSEGTDDMADLMNNGMVADSLFSTSFSTPAPAPAAQRPANVVCIPPRPSDTRQRFEIEVKRHTSFKCLWSSKGTLCEKPLSVWVPKSNTGLRGRVSQGKRLVFGHYSRPHFKEPGSREKYSILTYHVVDGNVLSAGDLTKWTDAVFPHPVSYTLQFHLACKGKPLFVWRPVPPSNDFMAIGDVCTVKEKEPLLTEVRCVPRSWLTRQSDEDLPIRMWDESTYGQGHAVTLWVTNTFGLFKVEPTGRTPAPDYPRLGQKFYADKPIDPASPGGAEGGGGGGGQAHADPASELMTFLAPAAPSQGGKFKSD